MVFERNYTRKTVTLSVRAEVSPGKAGDRMRIGFVGAGKVGFTMGKYFVEREICVSGYYSRSLNSSKEAANFTKTKYYETLDELIESSDTLFLTVPDGSIREVYSEVLQSDIEGKILCHCSGAFSSMIFSGIQSRGAFAYSVHPLFAVSHKLTSYQDFSKAFITIEGDERYLPELVELFQKLGNPVEVILTSQKVRYHAAAVFASNLVTGLYDMASQMMSTCGLSEEFSKKALLPLFLNNAVNIEKYGTCQALTGPVERGDAATISAHLQVLGEQERSVYTALSLQLIALTKQKNPKNDYAAIHKMLTQER